MLPLILLILSLFGFLVLVLVLLFTPNYKLVKFENNTFGVRRGWFYHEFRDFYGEGWWDASSKWIRNCGTAERLARNYFDSVTKRAAKRKTVDYEIVE